MRKLLLLIILVGLATGATTVFPQRAGGQSFPRTELGVNYNYVHTNAPPGGCGCFSPQGGNVWVGYRMTPRWSLVGEFGMQHAGNIAPANLDLTLSSYAVGLRYNLTQKKSWRPFGELLVGGAHASGSLAPGTGGLPGGPDAFAFLTGGGMDYARWEHFAIRPVAVDYFYTGFENGVNAHQNNIRISSGVFFRF